MSEITLEVLYEKHQQYKIGKQQLVQRQQQLTSELQQVVANINANEGAMQACELLIQQLQTNGGGDEIATIETEVEKNNETR